MKKLGSMLLMGVMVMSLAGCGGQEAETKPGAGTDSGTMAAGTSEDGSSKDTSADDEASDKKEDERQRKILQKTARNQAEPLPLVLTRISLLWGLWEMTESIQVLTWNWLRR